MIRSSLFSLLCLVALGFAVSSCDGDEVDITNTEIDPPMIEVEAGTINYTINGKAATDIGFSFVCRTDSVQPGVFAHSYLATNVDVSGLSDTSFILPIALQDLVISGYTEDVSAIEGGYVFFKADAGGSAPELVQCFDCPITMVEDDGVLSGTFSGTFATSNPDSVFVITDGTFEVPLIEVHCE